MIDGNEEKVLPHRWEELSIRGEWIRTNESKWRDMDSSGIGTRRDGKWSKDGHLQLKLKLKLHLNIGLLMQVKWIWVIQSRSQILSRFLYQMKYLLILLNKWTK